MCRWTGYGEHGILIDIRHVSSVSNIYGILTYDKMRNAHADIHIYAHAQLHMSIIAHVHVLIKHATSYTRPPTIYYYVPSVGRIENPIYLLWAGRVEICDQQTASHTDIPFRLRDDCKL